MSNQVKGTVKKVLDTETFSSGSTKQTLIISSKNGQYEDLIALDFWKDKAEALKGLNVGDEVEVSFDVRSREHGGKYYTNANGYKLQVLNQSQNATTSSYTGNPKQADTSDFGNPQGMYAPKPAAAVVEEDDSELPF